MSSFAQNSLDDAEIVLRLTKTSRRVTEDHEKTNGRIGVTGNFRDKLDRIDMKYEEEDRLLRQRERVIEFEKVRACRLISNR